MNDDLSKRSDTALVQWAARAGWDIDKETKESAKERCKVLANNPDPRLQISAIRALIEMDKIDQRDAHKQLDIEREANQSKVNIGTLNNISLTAEDTYRLIEAMDRKTIDHKP